MATPTHSQQEAEAQARSQRQGIIEPPMPVPEPTAETTRPDAEPVRQTQQAPEPAKPQERTQPPTRGPHDNKRADIVSRFRGERQAEKDKPSEEAENDAELRAFSQEGMPPELRHLDQPRDELGRFAEKPAEPEITEPEAPTEEVVEPETLEPQKYKLTIRGKEVEVTEEELRAAAQKSLAAETYLEDTKAKLNEANELLRQARDRIQRPDPASTQPAGQDRTQTAETGADGTALEQPESPYAKVVHELQYGDPAVATASLEQLIEAAADRKARENLERTRLADEAARANKIASDFEQENAELAKDKNATAVIKTLLFDMQREDIRALGIDLALLPDQSDDGIAKAHLWYRSKGFRVRDVPALLTAAKDTFLAWKGVQPKPAASAQPAAAKPRVEVAVNRAERRTVIQQQPARTATPKPADTPAVPEVRDRSDVVSQMRLQRGKPRGHVTVN